MTESTLEKTPTNNFSKSLIAGAAAGLSVDLLFFPVDTLKTRLQSVHGFLKSGGFKGLYRGVGSVALGGAPGAALFFTTYDQLNSSLPRHFPTLRSHSNSHSTNEEKWEPLPAVHMISSSLGEVAACLIRVPTEIVKQRSQASYPTSSRIRETTPSQKGVLSLSALTAKDVWREGGLRGFFRGFGTTVAREIPFAFIQFPLYERLKLIFNSPQSQSQSQSTPISTAAICGSISGGFAAFCTTPLDVCKTRIMLSRSRSHNAAETSSPPHRIQTSPTTEPAPPATRPPPPPPLSSSSSTNIHERQPNPKSYEDKVLKTFLRIYKEEGLRALWKGGAMRVGWIGAGGAVFLGVWERVKGVL